MNDSDQPSIQTAILAAVLENAVDAIINITPLGMIDSVNPAAEVMFGFSSEELLGSNISVLMPEPYRSQHDGFLANYLSTGQKKIIGVGREVFGQRKDGSTFPMHLAVSEIKVDGRHLFTGIVRDISDLKTAERELAEANERLEDRVRKRTSELRSAQADLVKSEKFATLGKVSGGIAHEIRNPLSAVKTSAYFLLNARNPSEEKVREHLERIDRQVTVIDNVVTALSDVAKLPDAELESTDVAAILRQTVNSVGLPDRIEVDISLGEDIPQVLADENQIVIAFANLIRNARDAMSNGGRLSISATVESDCVLFHIADTGSGIEEANLKKILEPLFTTKARGMGLGLSITQAILEKNKGSLSIQTQLGEGSCFTVNLSR